MIFLERKNIVEMSIYGMFILMVALTIMNNFIILQRIGEVKEARETTKELLRPAEIEVTKILLSNCQECFNIEDGLEKIRNQNVNITSERVIFFNENSAKELIDRYGIKKLPTLIISGEINKTEQLNNFFESMGNISDGKNFIFTNLEPAYYDTDLAKIVGQVSIINVIDSQCKECTSLTQAADTLKQSGVAIIKEDTYEYSSEDGKELIKRFGISRIPVILISSEINYYNNIKNELQKFSEEKNGFYALHAINPPYRDLESGEVVGLVKLILLTDNSCNECYDVEINKNILQRLGIVVNEEITYDIATKEGQELISKYNIEKVPVILLSPDVENYPVFTEVWKAVGSVDNNGWYIMRNPENLGTYRDLNTDEIIRAE